ncbi:MAG: adenine phosphoribosyltransferase [Nocardioidaceae bacterium]
MAQGWLDRLIRDVPDFPEPGVVFKDITPLLAHHQAFTDIVAALSDAARSVADGRIDVVAGIEARGFILAAPVSLTLGAGFVPVRKQGKLPGDTHAVSYSLEYGDATLEVKADAFGPGSRVLLLDDVLATGGTVAATADLVRETGADVVGVVVLLELGFLNGRARLGDLPVTALRTV